MRDLLRGSLRRSLRDLNAEDRLAAAWPVACGSALASRGEIGNLAEDGLLTVTVDSGEWMSPFLSARVTLASDLTKIAGVTVREIHFQVKPHTQPRFSAEGR